MRTWVRLPILALAVIALSAAPALAGGFLIYEHNGSATGMCGARAGIADDPSSMYYNPAAITELPGLQLQLGVTGIVAFNSYEGAGNPTPPRTVNTYDANGNPIVKEINDGTGSFDAKTHGFNPIHLYATYRIGETGLTAGFGLNNPFGLGTFWPGEWDGRFIATETDLKTFFSNPVIAVDLAKMLGFKDKFKLSLAAGYMFVYGQAHLQRRLDLTVVQTFSRGQIMDPWGEMAMTGSGIGHGWNLALYAELPDLIGFGFSIRGGFNEKGRLNVPFSGDAKFSFSDPRIRQFLSDSLGQTFPTGNKTTGDVTIKLPLHFNTGISYLGVPGLKVGLDFYVAFFQSYDQLNMSFSCYEKGDCTALAPVKLDKNWGTSWQVSIGAEYMLFDYLPIRVGYGSVFSPVPDDTYDPSLPDGRRDLITIGTGYHGKGWKADIGYMLAIWQGDKDNLVGSGDGLNPEGRANGHYETTSHLLGLTFTGAF